MIQSRMVRPIIRAFSNRSEPPTETLRKQWNDTARRIVHVPNAYRAETVLSREVAFFAKTRTSEMFPSFVAAQAEIREKLLVGNTDLAHGTDYSPDPYDEIQPCGRTSIGRLQKSFDIAKGPLAPDSQKFVQVFPHITQLILESAARLTLFTGMPHHQAKNITFTLLIYRPVYPKIIHALHSDGYAAIQIPLFSTYCQGTTSFQDFHTEPTFIESASDTAVVTKDLPHQAVVTVEEGFPPSIARRVVLNVMVS